MVSSVYGRGGLLVLQPLHAYRNPPDDPPGRLDPIDQPGHLPRQLRTDLGIAYGAYLLERRPQGHLPRGGDCRSGSVLSSVGRLGASAPQGSARGGGDRGRGDREGGSPVRPLRRPRSTQRLTAPDRGGYGGRSAIRRHRRLNRVRSSLSMRSRADTALGRVRNWGRDAPLPLIRPGVDATQCRSGSALAGGSDGDRFSTFITSRAAVCPYPTLSLARCLPRVELPAHRRASRTGAIDHAPVG